MSFKNIKTVHEGRGGYVLYKGARYNIDHIEAGHFSIHFPSGNCRPDLQEHLVVLTKFAESKDPPWYVENNSKCA